MAIEHRSRCVQKNVAEAQRLARCYIVGEDDYQRVVKLIEAAAERVTTPKDG